MTKELKPIRYVDAETGKTHEEQVYGGAGIRWLYGTWLGRLISGLVALPPLSRLYGWLQDRPASVRKIEPFIEQYQIRMDDFLPQEGCSPETPYSSFNQFFVRKVKTEARPFVQDEAFPVPCDARYFAYGALDDSVSVPVKGSFFKARTLLKNEQWQDHFANGPGFIARLCPVDYHRFHFPDDGELLDTWRVPGVLHSVNPWALAFREDIFMINERQVSILETAHFGKLAYVEVGATCVGRIQQTHEKGTFRRGEEKGMFLFGGSTVIVLGEKDRWQIDAPILERTQRGIETYLNLGSRLGSAL